MVVVFELVGRAFHKQSWLNPLFGPNGSPSRFAELRTACSLRGNALGVSGLGFRALRLLFLGLVV